LTFCIIYCIFSQNIHHNKKRKMKKYQLGVILPGIFELGCQRTINGSRSVEPTFTAQPVDTVVRSQENSSLFKGQFVDTHGGHTVTRAVITITGDNGFKIADVKDLVIVISSNAGGQVQYDFATLRNQQSIGLTLPLGTGQSLTIDVLMYNDLVHNARVKIGFEFFYTGPSGVGSIKREGPFIRTEISTVIFTPVERKALTQVLTSSEPEVYAFSLNGEGSSQRLREIEFSYQGTLGNETISCLTLYAKQGV
jgi:hypothetical protein